jgi:ABC-2 type transport system permease protein
VALLGLITGIYAETFDHVAAITSYIITPLAFLSGTFYSIKNLPEFWQNFAHYNPFFYMIDGFRYGMTGYSDGNISVGMSVILVFSLILWVICHLMISKGYRLKQ